MSFFFVSVNLCPLSVFLAREIGIFFDRAADMQRSATWNIRATQIRRARRRNFPRKFDEIAGASCESAGLTTIVYRLLRNLGRRLPVKDMVTTPERLISELSLPRVQNRANDALDELLNLLRADAESLRDEKESIEVSISPLNDTFKVHTEQ